MLVCSKEELIHKAPRQGDGRISLNSASPKARGWGGIYGIANKEAAWSEAWGTWGKRGTIIVILCRCN